MTVADWYDRQVYGVAPPTPEVVSVDADGDEVTLTLGGPGGELSLRVLVRLPDDRPAPVLLALNFDGNEDTISGTPRRERFPYDAVNARGYGIATLHLADVAPDDPQRYHTGVHRAMGLPHDPRPAGGTGALAAWAWGLSQARRYLETRGDVASVTSIGHSRLGKAALLAAARDPGFAGAISVQSGCGGAALFDRKGGERIADITTNFPHWFCPAFHGWRGRDAEVPHDQDALLSMIRPRPVVVLSAADDAWADTHAEERCAARVGAAYHRRPGKHEFLAKDWRTALDLLEARATD